MKIYKNGNKTISALSALERRGSAPQIVVAAPSGSGKSTLIYLLLNQRLVPHMRIGIGENSQTTIIPSEFCFDERIGEESSFAICVTKKEYASKEIHMAVLTVLMDLFGRNDYDTEDTIDAIEDSFLNQVLEPEEAHYHLNQIRNAISLDELKDALSTILKYMEEKDFKGIVKQRRNELKSKKVKLQEVRELVFEEMFETASDEVKLAYNEWLQKIGQIINRRLRDAIGEELFAENMVQYSLEEAEGGKVLETLFDPYAPYSFVIDYISIASRPREELKVIAQEKMGELPFRFCIRDTMGVTQRGIDATSIKKGLEVALNCKADAILFLLSLEERDDTLAECCKALIEKKEELKKKSNLDTTVYVLFTKADRKVENLINKRNEGGLYIDEKIYLDNINDVIGEIDDMVNEYVNQLPQQEYGWLSMRYLKDSYILKSLKDEDEHKHNFEPEGLFERIVDYSMKTLRSTLPDGVENPLFITAIEPDKPAIQVKVDPEKLKSEIKNMQHSLHDVKDIVNGYVIDERTPRLHGKSVSVYWNNLIIGLGHKTRASVYGNFEINMKGLLKRMLNNELSSFITFDNNSAVTFTADNLEDDVLMEAVKTLLGTDDIEVGMNPALGQRNIALQKLYEFYVDYFMDESRYASLIDRVAYDLSYGNPDLKQLLTKVYNYTPGYDKAMRKLQFTFKAFFGSDDFIKTLITEFNWAMTEMVNKTFIVI